MSSKKPGAISTVNTQTTKSKPLDLQSVRETLDGRNGPEYWRGLEQLADTEEFRDFLYREFPREASVMESGVDRRNFLKVMGASLALAGLTSACSRQPTEHIIPYVKPPKEMVPGSPLYFATAMPLAGYGIGLLAESHTGRPTKIEGNPQHPASTPNGATGIFSQASILSLYDPDRSTTPLRTGRISTWDIFTSAMDILINGEKDAAGVKIGEGLRDHGGAGIRILTESITSPSLAAQLRSLLNDMPEIRWHQYEPVNRDAARAGSQLAFGEHVETRYDLSKADVVLSLDADFLEAGPGSVRYAHDFAKRRAVEGNPRGMNRLYAVESTPSLTGAMADHAIHVAPSQVEVVARAIARSLGINAPGPDVEDSHQQWVAAVTADLKLHSGASAVVAGDGQPASAHALAHAMNAVLGNAGKTVLYTAPVEAEPVNHVESLRELVRDMEAGKVSTLFILGANPVYNAPADIDFLAALQNVSHRVHLGHYVDETGEHCHWHIPEAHFLESWGDVLALDGTASIIQPLIVPLYGGKTAQELIAVLSGKGGSAYDLVRQYWLDRHGESGFEGYWRAALSKGFVEGTAFPAKLVALRHDAVSTPYARPGEGELEVVYRPDPTVGDGRWANNGWLQELPKPLTKITWDNAVIISFNTAKAQNLTNFDVVDVKHGDRAVKGQIWIQPGHPDNTITLHLGYGRTRAGKVGNGTGFNAYALRTTDAPLFACGVELRRISSGPQLARTELHQTLTQEARPLVRVGTLHEFEDHPEFAQHMAHTPANDMTFFTPHAYDGYAWGMSIDLNLCMGCNACALACQAENNIPVVGREQVIKQREMHWIRVDRYYKGDPAGEPEVVHQPVPCMQCENAPCEVVCPVAATVHSDEGLNDMVYNRCVGTRYCSNNCPYKVRRFNFLEYSDRKTPVKQMAYNPNVTVRTRGVMEKCTYCVQRINVARIEAKKEGRAIRDGEVVTACQAVCPAGAIVFGDISDPESAVSKQKQSPRNYALLGDLNTRPRTTYLAKLRNPNPELEAPTTHGSGTEQTHGH
jgi:molybdopterin-containing oxidoreductase family iron-sulfur binding subunit